jgi:predicted ATPase with chaperone activity
MLDGAGGCKKSRCENEPSAHQFQQTHFGSKPKVSCNPRRGACELRKQAMTENNLSARAEDRILKVARTTADLVGAKKMSSDHLPWAIQSRALDRPLQS